jgi:hypothetical protein
MPQVYPTVEACATAALRDAWIVFLGRWQWEWFGTFTFRAEVHPEAADKRFRVLCSKINRELYGPRWYKKRAGVPWVRALEYQRRGVIHYHALFAGVQDLRRFSWMEEWDRLAGFARIEPIRMADAVQRYVSKYVIKGGEIDLGGSLYEASRPLFNPQAFSRPDVDLFGSEPGSVKAGVATALAARP